jgi:multiple sugar transport system permease protein/putative chitobiose transport system permease protein
MSMNSPLAPPSFVRVGVMAPIAALLAGVFVLPFVWMVISSLRPGTEIFQVLSPLNPAFYISGEYSLANYTALLDGLFMRSLYNSLIVAAVTIIVGLAISSMAAYALSALRFPLRDFVFVVVVISFLVPFDAIAVPLSGVFRDWGLQNSYIGLVLPGLANGLAIFMLRQFFLAVPRELSEAAKVDGAGTFAIYWRIYLPLSRSALVGAGLVLFLFQWRSYLWPLLIVSNPEMDVAPVALAKFAGQFDVDFGQMFAGAVLVTLVPAILLYRFQRYLVQSIKTAGIG